MYLKYQAGYDDGFLAKVGGTNAAAEAYIKSALPHVQVSYCHSSLGTKISVQRIGDIKHYSGRSLQATGAKLEEMMGTTRSDLGTADLMMYMGYERYVPLKFTSLENDKLIMTFQHILQPFLVTTTALLELHGARLFVTVQLIITTKNLSMSGVTLMLKLGTSLLMKSDTILVWTMTLILLTRLQDVTERES